MDKQELKKEISQYDFLEFDAKSRKRTRERLRKMVDFLYQFDPDLLNAWIYEYEENGNLLYTAVFSKRVQIKYLIWRKLKEYPEKFAQAYFSRYCNQKIYKLICDGGAVIEKCKYVALENIGYKPKTIGKYLYEMANLNDKDNDGIVITEDWGSQITKDIIIFRFCASYKDNVGNENKIVKEMKSTTENVYQEWKKMSGVLKRRAEFLAKDDNQQWSISKDKIVFKKSLGSWNENNEYVKIIIFLSLNQISFSTSN